MAKKNNKIKDFFKKIYYSIFKIDKYGELAESGLKASFIYIRNIIFILAAIYATVYLVRSVMLIRNYREYLMKNLPPLTYENGLLTVESEERTVLDNEIIKMQFGAIVAIDTTPNYEDLKSKYIEEHQKAIIFTSDKIIIINTENNVKEYTYNEFIDNHFSVETEKIEKEDFVNIISNIQSPYYFVIMALSYLIVSLFFVTVYNLIVSYILYVMYRCKKNKIKFSKVYTISMYASTILTLGILIVVFMPRILGSILEILLLIFTLIYANKAFKLNIKIN